MKIIVIRIFAKSDLEQVLALFYTTIHTINSKDYSMDQLNAWGLINPDKKVWLNSLEANIVYVAISE